MCATLVLLPVQFSARDFLETALMPVGGSGPAVERHKLSGHEQATFSMPIQPHVLLPAFLPVQFSARDYLETALMPVGGAGPAVEAKNAIRSSIKGLFPDRDCATLVRPMHDELVRFARMGVPVVGFRCALCCHACVQWQLCLAGWAGWG